MKIKFTVFNGGQEHMEFDLSSLKNNQKLDKFLVNADDKGIYIVPMIVEDDIIRFQLPVLEKV